MAAEATYTTRRRGIDMGCSSGQAGAIAAIALKTTTNALIADMLSDAAKEATAAQKEIADQIQGRANALHGVWQNSYLPCELAVLAEICGEPEQVANTFVHEQRAVASVTKKFSVARQQMEYCMPSACVGAKYEGNYLLAREQARAESWQAQIAKRTEIARVDMANAQRLENRINITTIGRNGAAKTAGAGAGAGEIYRNLAEQSASAFNSAAKVAGRVVQMISSKLTSGSGDKTLENSVGNAGDGSTQTSQQRTYTREDLRDTGRNIDADVWTLPPDSTQQNAPVAAQTGVQSEMGTTYDGVFYPDI